MIDRSKEILHKNIYLNADWINIEGNIDDSQKNNQTEIIKCLDSVFKYKECELHFKKYRFFKEFINKNLDLIKDGISYVSRNLNECIKKESVSQSFREICKKQVAGKRNDLLNLLVIAQKCTAFYKVYETGIIKGLDQESVGFAKNCKAAFLKVDNALLLAGENLKSDFEESEKHALENNNTSWSILTDEFEAEDLLEGDSVEGENAEELNVDMSIPDLKNDLILGSYK